VTCDCPYLYALNPRRPGISLQGLRDRVFAIPKPPPGTHRILVLGDSIAYGVGVSPGETFAKVLERQLDRPGRRVEVINAGVLGYTAYNEERYYAARGRDFQPDVVVVAFCMNDVADPELHWSGTRHEARPGTRRTPGRPRTGSSTSRARSAWLPPPLPSRLHS